MGQPPSVLKMMPARDWDLLRRYAAQEPFGPWRDNFNIAVVGAALFNLNRGKNDPRNPDHFMYKPPKPRTEVEAERGERVLEFVRTAARPANKGTGTKRRKRAATVFLGD